MYNTFDQPYTLYLSSSGLKHIGGDFRETYCGSLIDDRHHGRWSWHSSVSFDTLIRMSNNPRANKVCRKCFYRYKEYGFVLPRGWDDN